MARTQGEAGSFPSFTTRQSLYPSQNLNPLLQSASKSGPSGYGRTPLRNSARRASQWTGTQSMVPPPSSLVHPVKDPRALRDKLVQQGMRNAVAVWLQETGYPGTSIKQILNSITAKDFRNMVEHFTRLLDPVFEPGEGKKFEDELIPALRKHQYPYADTIKEEWLKAPASMHSWPSLLVALHWLAELSKAKLNYLDASDDPTLQEIEQVPEVFEDPNHERALAYHFLTESYAVFLTPSDDFPEQERVMEERYVKKGDKITSELEALRAEFEQLAQTQTKMNADPIIQLKQDNGSLKSDKKKFEEILVHHHEKKKKLSSNIEVGREHIANLSLELQRQRDEQEQLSAEVRKQNLSPEEVSQMNSDHTNLNRTLDELKRRLKESGEHTRKLEVLWANRSEAVEREIDCYNTLLAKLALIPTLPPPLPQIDLRLDSNFASRKLVCRMSDRSVVNLKGETKQALDAVAESTRKRRRDEQAANGASPTSHDPSIFAEMDTNVVGVVGYVETPKGLRTPTPV
ncbi:hypothetical protein BD410DRAFT_735210 [Rickenella mellea]|uniref:Kinetochore protein NDC80 n=1 Tax=Rickenella mellea TaxID=50990 RepID=A0A4Y7PFG1_9AGAM|nr:hypothetical protein BD410DRAFT_735210 [Rickenella mellea]